MALTASDFAAIAAMLDAKLDSKLATILPSVPATPIAAPVSQESIAVVVPVATEVSTVKGWTPEQLAADAVDPERNAYTPIVRAALFSRKVDSEYYRLYEPLWRTERERLKAAGISEPGKQAQVNFAARLKIERERLALRDGQVSGRMAPVISAEMRKSSGTHADPTANQAIGNVSNPDRAARMAELQAEMDRLNMDDVVLSVIAQPAKSLTRSAAQKRAGTNPFEFSVVKLVRDAKNGSDPAAFVKGWLHDSTLKSPKTSHIARAKAVEALKRLGYTVQP